MPRVKVKREKKEAMKKVKVKPRQKVKEKAGAKAREKAKTKKEPEETKAEEKEVLQPMELAVDKAAVAVRAMPVAARAAAKVEVMEWSNPPPRSIPPWAISVVTRACLCM